MHINNNKTNLSPRSRLLSSSVIPMFEPTVWITPSGECVALCFTFFAGLCSAISRPSNSRFLPKSTIVHYTCWQQQLHNRSLHFWQISYISSTKQYPINVAWLCEHYNTDKTYPHQYAYLSPRNFDFLITATITSLIYNDHKIILKLQMNVTKFLCCAMK